jgi:dolichol-phosphate mannosyltransferase
LSKVLYRQLPRIDACEVVLSIVVPTFNERENVSVLVDRIAAALPYDEWEIVFVDDDSTDGTPDVLLGLCRKYRNVRMLRRIGRRGLSSAVIEGVLSTSAPFVAVLDADLQHDEKILPQMLNVLKSGEAELVVGSRYTDGGGLGDWDERRKQISRIATQLTKLVIDVDLSDPMSGFFAVKRSTFELAVRDLSAQGYKILLDIIASSPKPPVVRELPYVFATRAHGESKLDALVALEYVNLIIDKLFGKWIPVRFVLFAAIGVLGIFVHMAALASLLAIGALFVYGQTAAALTAMTFNFFLNNLLTYRDKRIKGVIPLTRGLLSFLAVCSLGAVANVGIANVLFHRDYNWWASALAGILVGAVWNYSATSVFTWRRV